MFQRMLDAMVELLTGEVASFDPDFFAELVDCMQRFDVHLKPSQVGKQREGLSSPKPFAVCVPEKIFAAKPGAFFSVSKHIFVA